MIELEVGSRVRIFTPGRCWYHGSPGRVAGRGPSGEHAVEPDGEPGRRLYLHVGSASGIEAWAERRPVACGFPCADA
jgi:hypothetical protein